jgi:hypothetical protein
MDNTCWATPNGLALAGPHQGRERGRAARAAAPNQPLQSRHRVRDPAAVPNLAAQAALRYCDDDPLLVNIKPDIRDTIRSPTTRLLCMRLGTGQSGATLVRCILRDGSPRPQADMWSREGLNNELRLDSRCC